MRVAVSVVLWRPSPEDLTTLARSLAAWKHGPVLVHVNEDDGSVVRRIEALLPSAEVTGSRRNDGFAGGHNALLGAAFAAHIDAVVVHNPDLVLEPGAVEAMLAAADATNTPTLVGPALQLATGGTLAGEGLVDSLGIVWTRSSRHFDSGQGQIWEPPSGPPRAVAGVSGACLLVTKPVHDKVVALSGEFFDEDFIAYREDAELAFRAGLLGVPSIVVFDAHGRHARGSRGTSRGASKHIDRLGVRNRFLLAAKYGRHRPGGLLRPLARDAIVVAGVLLRERSSAGGLWEALRLRRHMREKGRRVLDVARVTSKAAARLD